MKIVTRFDPIDAKQWHPVTVRTDDDVARLNTMFRNGWRLEGLDLDGLPCLAFTVSMDGVYPPQTGMITTASARVLVLVLTRGIIKDTQRARIVTPDDRGYIDMARLGTSIREDEVEWSPTLSLPMENRSHLVILERA